MPWLGMLSCCTIPQVDFDSSITSAEALVSAVEDSGFDASLISVKGGSEEGACSRPEVGGDAMEGKAGRIGGGAMEGREAGKGWMHWSVGRAGGREA